MGQVLFGGRDHTTTPLDTLILTITFHNGLSRRAERMAMAQLLLTLEGVIARNTKVNHRRTTSMQNAKSTTSAVRFTEELYYATCDILRPATCDGIQYTGVECEGTVEPPAQPRAYVYRYRLWQKEEPVDLVCCYVVNNDPCEATATHCTVSDWVTWTVVEPTTEMPPTFCEAHAHDVAMNRNKKVTPNDLVKAAVQQARTVVETADHAAIVEVIAATLVSHEEALTA
jgi:hypothetical protein